MTTPKKTAEDLLSASRKTAEKRNVPKPGTVRRSGAGKTAADRAAAVKASRAAADGGLRDGVHLLTDYAQKAVGILRQSESGAVVELDRSVPELGRVVKVPRKYLNGAPFGMLVVLDIVRAEPPYGKILEVLGDPGRPDIAIQAIVRSYGLDEAFPDEVLAESSALPAEPGKVEIRRELRNGRRDLRALHTLTIDGLDAKDLDDAIDVLRIPEGYRLYVHIADVTHYVRLHTALNREALRRGNSVYLVDRVLPMLPPKLSNGLCSLNPDKDRYALTCEMDFDENGRCLRGDIYESIIRSKLRTSYEEISELFAGAPAEADRPSWFAESIELMRRLAALLARKRRERGALAFAFPETEAELDAQGRPLRIFGKWQNEANELIESFMVAANEWVAAFCDRHSLPAVYRVHEEPDSERIDTLIQVCRKIGVKLKLPAAPSPGELQQLLDSFADKPWKEGVSQLLLRSLARARYDTEDLGHYGLASPQYLHFTSPIRRYSDEVVHRSLKAFLHGKKMRKNVAGLKEIARHLSVTERIADDAERGCMRRKICEYYASRLGEEYSGRISGISGSGLYVELPSTAEGSVLFSALNRGFFKVDDAHFCAVNSRSGECFAIGDPLRVRIARVDLERSFVDLDILSHTSLFNGSEYSSDKGAEKSAKKGRKKNKIKIKKRKGKKKK